MGAGVVEMDTLHLHCMCKGRIDRMAQVVQYLHKICLTLSKILLKSILSLWYVEFKGGDDLCGMSKLKCYRKL